MRYAVKTVVLIGVLMVPVAGLAAAAAGQTQAASKHSSSAAASHATSGVVKSIDSTTLVITRSGKKNGDMTFSLDPAVHREGMVDVGTPVSVRYRTEGKSYIATAITAQQPKKQTAHKTS